MQHGFNVEHARRYGLDEAIMIRSFEYWINTNRANEWHLHDGRTWSYNSLRAFQEQFPYWTLKQIRRTLTSLVDQGVLMKGHYGKDEGWNTFNRTLWYAFADEKAFLPRLLPVEATEPICPKGQMHVPESDTCIDPDNAFAQEGTSICPGGQIDVPKRANESKETLGTPLGTACEVQQAASRVHAREEPDPTACLPAFSVTDSPTGTGTPNGALEVGDTPCAPAPAPAPAPAREAAPSEGAALLLRPVAEGGAGFDSLEAAERAALGREPLLLTHWIRLAKRRKAENVAGFLVAAFKRGDAPPESYLKAVKASFQGGGGILGALGLGNAIGSSPAAQGIRQEAGPPPSWDEPEDEDDEPEEDVPPRKAPPPRAEPKPAYFEKWRGHA